MHVYVFETHLNNVPIPIDPAEDAGLLARVRTPRCPLPARQGAVLQVARLKGEPSFFGAPEDEPEPEDMDEDDEVSPPRTSLIQLEYVSARIEEAEASLRALERRLRQRRSFALESDAFWAQYGLSELRLRRTAARAQRSALLAGLDAADDPSTARILLARALAVRVASHAALREADYVAALVLAHVTVLSLNAAARHAQALGADAVKDEVAPMALLRLALAALLQDAAFWDPERRESQLTLRRRLERWGDEAGAEEGIEVGGLLDSLGVV